MKRRTFLLGGCAAAASGLMPLTGFFDLKAYATDRYRYQIADEIFKDRFALVDPALDAVQSVEDAARFLQTATLGTTLDEINQLFTGGSYEDYVNNQVNQSHDGSDPMSEWQFSSARGKFVPKAGWYNKVFWGMSIPDGENNGPNAFQAGDASGSGRGCADRPNDGPSDRMVHTALMYNRPVQGGLFNPGMVSELHPTAPKKQIQNKVLHALCKFIPISGPGGGLGGTNTPGRSYDLPAFYELLGRHAFGNYADFMEELSLFYPMGKMLTHYRGDRNNPDQNYARELLQLFTIGPFRLNAGGQPILDFQGNLIPNYTDQDDIPELARVFTGYNHPFALRERYYDDPELPANFNSATNFDRNEGQGALDGTDPQRFQRSWYATVFRQPNATPQNIRQWGTNPFNASQTYYEYRAGLEWVKRGDRYRIEDNTNAQGFLQAIGAPDTAVGAVFTATADGNPQMTSGMVEREVTTLPGQYPRLKITAFQHDFGAKFTPNLGWSVPADVPPNEELRLMCRFLVRHPSCAPFVAKNLIQRLTTSNPTPEYVARVASVFVHNVDSPTQMGKVVKAILLDREALGARLAPEAYGRINDPFELTCRLIKGFNYSNSHMFEFSDQVNNSEHANRQDTQGTFGSVLLTVYYRPGPNHVPPQTAPQNKIAGFIYLPSRPRGNDPVRFMIQNHLGPVAPGWSPSIFGPYSPDHTQLPASASGLVAPTAQIYTPSRYALVMQWLERIAFRGPRYYRDGKGERVNSGRRQPEDGALGWSGWSHDPNNLDQGTLSVISYDFLGDLADAENVIGKVDLLLTAGRTPAAVKSELLAVLNTMPTATLADRENRVGLAIQTLMQGNNFFVS